MSKDAAINSGAECMFIEKYPDTVTVYSIGDISKELCGGPHVKNTSELGKFVIKKEEIHNIWQRDVNNYCFDDDGKAETKGEAVNAYNKINNPIASQLWNSKEPPIIAKGIVDYLLYGITPEETVEKYKNQLTLYQYACKTMSFDYCMYETIDSGGKETKEKSQNLTAEPDYIGHRQRLKARFLSDNGRSMPDYELLELTKDKPRLVIINKSDLPNLGIKFNLPSENVPAPPSPN